MLVRATSAIAFAENMASGLIDDLRLLVYNAVHDAPHSTANEISRRPEFAGYQIDSVRPRFAELRRVGIIAEGAERKDQHTDKLSITWHITNIVAQEADFETLKARIFWGVKREGRVGSFYSNREQAQQLAVRAGLTVIKLREVR